MSALLLALLLQATPAPGVEAAPSPVPAATHDADRGPHGRAAGARAARRATGRAPPRPGTRTRPR